VGNSWPPYGLLIINPFGIPFLNTCILLSSGVSVTWCHYCILSNYISDFSLLITILLALFFVFIQGMEYYKLF
jgi:cytochrome c oxidase subunit 3